MDLLAQVPADWRAQLQVGGDQPNLDHLASFLAAERAAHSVFPPADDVFNALGSTPFDQVRAVILGQDPYHDDGQAHGLAFSVRHGVKPPPSLVNIFKELEADLGLPRPKHGNLDAWARGGVLLLNTVLTVRAHQPGSHRGNGWEPLTDAVIGAVNRKPNRVVFVLWGAHAQKKVDLIDQRRHAVVQSAHPSPLSAKNGFFGSRPFSRVNEALREAGQPVIDWRIE